MRGKGSCVLDGLARFRRREEGSVTIEAVLWLPVFMAFLVLVVDATMIFSNRTQALRIIQDANRSFAIGRLDTIEDTKDFVLARLQQISPSAQVETTVATGMITTQVWMPSREIDALGLFSQLVGITVRVGAQHMAEN